MTMFHATRELEHAARWVSLYRKTDPSKAAEWQARWDKLYDDSMRVVAIASDGEPITADQTPWVQAQVHPAQMLPPTPSTIVNRTGRAERVIRRVMGQRDEDDGDDPKPVLV
jgi:hypothetical protein